MLLSIRCIYLWGMAKKQMISIRFNKKLLQHLKQQPEVKESGLTDYVEDACKKKSKYKEAV